MDVRVLRNFSQQFKKQTQNPINKISSFALQLAALGGFILFFGFFAFNAGSQASISAEGDAGVIGLACINTIISGAFAAITALIVQHLADFINDHSSKWSLLATINGGLTGMVSKYHPYFSGQENAKIFVRGFKISQIGTLPLGSHILAHLNDKRFLAMAHIKFYIFIVLGCYLCRLQRTESMGSLCHRNYCWSNIYGVEDSGCKMRNRRSTGRCGRYIQFPFMFLLHQI